MTAAVVIYSIAFILMAHASRAMKHGETRKANVFFYISIGIAGMGILLLILLGVASFVIHNFIHNLSNKLA